MTKKIQAFCLFFLFSLLTFGCDYDCPDCHNDDEDRPEWLPEGGMRDPGGLPIHAIRVWEPNHRFAFEALYERNYLDLCITTNSAAIPQVMYVRGDLITENDRIDKSFLLELWNTEELIGVYCKRLLINDQYALDLARYRATIVGQNWNWNQRIMEIRYVPYEE